MNYYQILKEKLNSKVYYENETIIELQGTLTVTKVIENLNSISLKEIFNYFGSSLLVTFTNKKTKLNTSLKNDTYIHYLDDFQLVFFKSSEEVSISMKIFKNKFQDKIFKDCLKIENQDLKMITFFDTRFALNFLGDSLIVLDKAIMGEKRPKFILYFPCLNIKYSQNEFSVLVGNDIFEHNLKISEWEKLSISNQLVHERVEQRNLHCVWPEATPNLIPEMFWFKNTFTELTTFKEDWGHYTDEKEIIYALCNIYIELFMSFICNFTNEKSFKIVGYRTIEIKKENGIVKVLSADSIVASYNLYSFIYSSQIQDKISISRNMMSVNIHQESSMIEVLNYLPDVYKSVQNSFNIYMGKKLEDFLDKKLELEKHARETAKDISEEISNSISLITRNLLAFIGSSLVGFVSYTTKGNVEILWLTTIAYIIFVFISTMLFAFFSINKKQHALEVFRHYTEINQYVDKDAKKNIMKEIVSSREKLFNVFWYGSIIINLLLIGTILIFSFVISENIL